MRDRRLYWDTHHADFICYGRDRFGKTKQAVNYLIAAAEIYENLMTTIGCHDLDEHTTTNGCRVFVIKLLITNPGEQREKVGL